MGKDVLFMAKQLVVKSRSLDNGLHKVTAL